MSAMPQIVCVWSKKMCKHQYEPTRLDDDVQQCYEHYDVAYHKPVEKNFKHKHFM